MPPRPLIVPDLVRQSGLGLLALSLLCAGCVAERGENDLLGGAGDGAGGLDPDGGSGDDGDDPGADPGDVGDGGAKFDVAEGEPGGGSPEGEDEGCRGIDFLFVVDNSGSMKNEQDALIASFPGFIAAIESKVDVHGEDHHIMVVDSDLDGRWVCEPAVHDADPTWPDICGSCPYDTCPPTSDSMGLCTGYWCGAGNDVLEPDDSALGCGVVRPFGGNASNNDCGVPDGRRFIKSSTQNLTETFSCMARVGTSGHSLEQPVSSMLAAVSDEHSAAEGCNAGFVRADAILVVVLITDDNDEYQDGTDESHYGFGGSPQTWYDTLLAAKAGDPAAVVMVGLLATPEPIFGADCDHGQSCPAAGPCAAEKFMEFVGLFGDQGIMADTCEDDYAPLLEQAVELIDTTCENYVPPEG